MNDAYMPAPSRKAARKGRLGWLSTSPERHQRKGKTPTWAAAPRMRRMAATTKSGSSWRRPAGTRCRLVVPARPASSAAPARKRTNANPLSESARAALRTAP